jgi:hypothetical protein
MNPWLTYLTVAGGIALSVFLPILRSRLPKRPAALSGDGAWKPYVWTGFFSLGVGVLIMASVNGEFESYWTALMAGYMGDSTLQKFTTGNRAGV